MNRRPALITAGLTISLITLLLPARGDACTNFLLTRGSTTDKSTMITYAADSHELYGELYFTPAATHKKGAMLQIKEWDTGKLLGKIKQVEKTFSVVGNMNEHQVSIGETTYGGRKELMNQKLGIDYGSLIYVTLQRAKTAREAIKIMTDLVAEYGYYSSGETFSIADPKEVWIMDLIGKGPGEKGAVWVARRVPDGYVTAHANQARIRTFPLNDPKNCLYAKDVITFARKKGYFKGKDADFSFTDAYAPTSCRDLRVRDGRVWSMYNRVAPSLKISADYILCKRGAKPLPLWVKPDRKLTPKDVMNLMRDHFEGTVLDMSKGPGAGPFKLPYRWRPLTWKVNGKNYLNERATATQQTGFSFVAQAREGMAGPVGGVLWFSVDDAASTVYVPMYAGITEAPFNYRVGTGDFKTFTWDSAFWTFTFVSNFAYSRYSDMIVDIKKVQTQLEGEFLANQAAFEKKALEVYKKSPAAGLKLLTEYSAKAAEKVVKRWQKLGQELLMKYMDGNVRDEKGKVTHPKYPDSFYENIVKARPEHFLMPDKDPPLTDAQRLALPKLPPKKVAPKPTNTCPKPKPAPAPKCAPCEQKKSKGCSCTVGGSSSAPTLPLLLVLLFGLTLFVRRRLG